MSESQAYRFWFWRNKLESILYLLAHVCDYDLIIEEYEVLLKELRGTNNEENNWQLYEFKGTKGTISFKLAYDEEYPNEMVLISIENVGKFRKEIEFINTIQCMFKELPLEDSNE